MTWTNASKGTGEAARIGEQDAINGKDKDSRRALGNPIVEAITNSSAGTQAKIDAYNAGYKAGLEKRQ